MQIKDILVHVDSTQASDRRVLLALNIARRFKAYVTGMFVIPSPDLMIRPETATGAVAIATAIAAMEEAADVLGDQFMAMLQADQLRGEWVRLMGDPVPLITRRAGAADLVILGQRDPSHAATLDTPEDVILSCGRPVLVVPHTGQFEHVGEQLVVAWNGSRESARALDDALPLAAQSSGVAVVSVNPTEEVRELGGELVSHLGRHGLHAESEMIEDKEVGATDLVLARAATFGSDLIVMGAYSHSRLRELVLGGMTQDMLRRMTRPVLMAH